MPMLDWPRTGQWRHPATVRSLREEKVMSIGRGPGNDVVLTDLRVSRRHAELRIADGGYEIVDVGSRGGTYVNGQRVERASGRRRFTWRATRSWSTPTPARSACRRTT